MKIRKPIASNIPQEKKAFPNGGAIRAENAHYRESDCVGGDFEELILNHCTLERIDMTGSTIEEAYVQDTFIKGCTFAAANFTDTRIERVEASSSRMQGIVLIEATLEDVVFKNCKLQGANFTDTTLKRVVFDACDLGEAHFSGATFNEVLFTHCTLNSGHFSQASFKNVDIRGSMIEGVALDVAAYKGLTVDSGQALYLAAKLGLVIEG